MGKERKYDKHLHGWRKISSIRKKDDFLEEQLGLRPELSDEWYLPTKETETLPPGWVQEADGILFKTRIFRQYKVMGDGSPYPMDPDHMNPVLAKDGKPVETHNRPGEIRYRSAPNEPVRPNPPMILSYPKKDIFVLSCTSQLKLKGLEPMPEEKFRNPASWDNPHFKDGGRFSPPFTIKTLTWQKEEQKGPNRRLAEAPLAACDAHSQGCQAAPS